MPQFQIDIASDVASLLRDRNKPRPQHSNRASLLGGPCDRRCVYQRTHWDQEQSLPESTQGIFATGNELEAVSERIDSRAGMAASPRWRVVGAQSPIVDKMLLEHEITGHVDGLLEVEQPDGSWETTAAYDRKHVGVWAESIRDVERMRSHKWMSKWYSQINLYASAFDLEWCVCMMIRKDNLWRRIPIVWRLDREHVSDLVAKSDRINLHVKNGTLPDRIDDVEECGRCSFAHICGPRLSFGRDAVLDDPKLEELLDQREALRASHKEFDEVNTALKAMLPEQPVTIVGRHLVKATLVPGGKRSFVVKPHWRRTFTAIKDT